MTTEQEKAATRQKEILSIKTIEAHYQKMSRSENEREATIGRLCQHTMANLMKKMDRENRRVGPQETANALIHFMSSAMMGMVAALAGNDPIKMWAVGGELQTHFNAEFKHHIGAGIIATDPSNELAQEAKQYFEGLTPDIDKGTIQ